MNPRIQELANQAFDTAEYPADQQYRIEPNPAFCKKFAELIVRECADKCLAMAYVNPGPHHYAAMIKEHFGVEE